MHSGDSSFLDVAVIGAGFGGICTAKRLLDEGIDNFLVFDRSLRVGGTWEANTYPGAQCDIPAALYSFSFAPKPDWSRLYPLQPELFDYLQKVSDDFGVTPHLRLDHEVLDLTWIDEDQMWSLRTSEGEWAARVVVGAIGPFSEPANPHFEGIEDFRGEVQRSANWDHDRDWSGKRIGVIGTGASGVQIIPQAQAAGKSLTVFQRTPTWIMPHPDRPIPGWMQNLFERVPATQRALRTSIDLALESMVPGLVWRPSLLKGMEAVARMHLRRQVRDPELREALTPQYMFGCKRPTFSNKYYPAMAASNTEVVTEGIKRIVPEGVETRDGRVHELDVLVLATGFKVAGHPFYDRVHDSNGVSLTEQWSPSPYCYMGTAANGFPNLFQILGPNAAVYTSMVVVIEAQVEYIISALEKMREHGLSSLEVREDVIDAYTEELDGKLAGSVWNSGGCASYYLDANGRNVAWFPGFFRQFRARTKSIKLADYLSRDTSAQPLRDPSTPAESGTKESSYS